MPTIRALKPRTTRNTLNTERSTGASEGNGAGKEASSLWPQLRPVGSARAFARITESTPVPEVEQEPTEKTERERKLPLCCLSYLRLVPLGRSHGFPDPPGSGS